MSTEGILTVVGLIVAVYTLLPLERRLNLRLRIRPLDLVVIAAAFCLVHYIKFLPVFAALGAPDLGPWRWGFDPDKASYLVLFVAAVFVAARVKTARLSPRRIATFQDLAETLLFSEKFAELLFLLERNLADLRRLIESRMTATRLRDWIKPHRMARVFGREVDIDGRSPDTWLVQQLPTGLRQWLAQIPPSHDDSKRQAERILERIFLSPPFVDYLAKARPYFGLEVLLIGNPFFRAPFLEMFIVALLKNENSVLYEEIKQTQTTSEHGRYIFDSLNPFNNFFFGERFRADEMKLYKPFGDAVSEHLKMLGRNRSSDPYRQPPYEFFEAGRWRSPVYAGRCIFEYMITEGLHRGLHWHMWLMYLEYWTGYIVHNMADLGPDIDQSREWPTAYHYLLYDLFATQVGWINTAAQLDPTLKSVLIGKVDLDYGSIAKSAALSLGGCLRIVVEAEHVTPQFKGYLLGVVANGYTQVVEHKRDALARMYETAMVTGGTRYRELDRFRIGLAEAIPRIDQDSSYMAPAADLIKKLSGVAAGVR